MRSAHTHGRPNPFLNRQALKTGGRSPFMERVRAALGRTATAAPADAPPERDEALVRQFGAGDAGRVERWIERAKVNSMVVSRSARAAEAVRATIGACLANHKVAKCVLNAHELEERFGLCESLEARGAGVVRWGSPGCFAAAFECEASVTDCRAGLADAGSILVWSDAKGGGFGRSSTLVTPVHVVLLPASRILPDMIDGLELVVRELGGAMPSNVVVINGPSKTADIEMNLVTGVHGPKYLYVVVIDGM